MGIAIVHFGMHKTGSTSIQQSLYRRLADPRFHYIDLGVADAGPRLAAVFQRQPEDATLRARLDRELRDSGPRTAILSAERLSDFNASEFGALRAAVAAQGKEVALAVGYVRRPKERMEGVFQQWVRVGRRFSLEELYPAYRRSLEKFDQQLGRERVQLWRFAPEAFPSGCVVQDFCARLDIRFPPRKVIRANEGVSRPALSLLLAYHRLAPGHATEARTRRARALLARRAASVPGPKLRLHSSVVAPILDAQRADLEWIEARLGASLTEDLEAQDAQSIRCEDDLLEFSPESLQWLAEQLGPPYLDRPKAQLSPQEVSQWMHALSLRLLEEERIARGP
jgi:hypothetical protein